MEYKEHVSNDPDSSSELRVYYFLSRNTSILLALFITLSKLTDAIYYTLARVLKEYLFYKRAQNFLPLEGYNIYTLLRIPSQKIKILKHYSTVKMNKSKGPSITFAK